MAAATDIIITTLNARYIHASLGARYLLANMGPLRSTTRLIEHTINTRATDIVEDLLRHQPTIIGFGVYIWNAEETLQVVKLLKTIAPEITIILGGPEVSYELDSQAITSLSDYVIVGQADKAFAEICQGVLNNTPPLQKIIRPQPFSLAEINLPYDEYSDEDIANRVVYVEASRGCPFKCEFCLSSLDKTVYPFDLEMFLQQMQKLFDKGVRSFKFIDRTFNLKVATSIRIMEFFLAKMSEDNVYLHFELIPDHLPEKLKTVLQRFPKQSIQFEIGIQSFNPDIQILISRKQDNNKSIDNLRWIKQHTHAHIHTDLIIGLPGETIDSFANGFDTLVSLKPHEIQVGILKRLRGTPIIRHTDGYDMRYSPTAPYSILSNSQIDFTAMQQLKRFARYWDIIANSGRFKHSIDLLLGNSPFNNFLTLSNWLHKESGQTHKISLGRLFSLLYRGMTEVLHCPVDLTAEVLLQDFAASGLKSKPDFITPSPRLPTTVKGRSESRQKRHQV